MLNSKSDYKKIRDIMFGSEGHDRITVDANVLHSRTQNRIHRNIDQFYLKELNSLYEGNDLDNSIEFNYPIPLDTPLPYPSIDDYYDEEKLKKAGFSKPDIFNWKGGSDPDYEALEQENAQALEEQENGIRNENQRYQNEKTEYQNSHQAKLEELNKNLSDIDKKYASILDDYQNKLSKIEEENSTAIEQLDNEKSEIDGMKSSGQITISEWNKKRYDLDQKYYDQQDDYMQKRTSNELEYIGQVSAKGIEQYDISCQISDENRNYESGMEEKKSIHETNIKNIQKTCSERRNRVYLSSNGNNGEAYYQNRMKLDDGISASKVYPSALNIKKAIPWIPESDKTKFIEYNNRLMADWENCRLKRVSDEHYDFSKKIGGMMERYKGYTTDGYPVEYNNFVVTPAIMMKKEYRPYEGKDDESSTFTAIDNTFRVRFGNRTQSGHVDRILVPIICDASGEDGQGYKYVLAEAQFIKVLGQDWLTDRDSEDDLHLKNTQKIDDEFKESSSSLKTSYDNDIHELEIQYQLDIDNLKYEMSSEIEEQRKTFIQSVDELRINANTLAVNGKDNSGIISQISSMTTKFNSTVNEITSKYDDKKLKLSTKLQQDKSNRLSKYNSDLNALRTQMNSKKSEENNRHDNALNEIQSEYNKAYDTFIKGAEKIREDAKNKIQENNQKLSDQNENAIDGFNQNMVSKWNSALPGYPVSESYNFYRNGNPYPGEFEPTQYYIGEIAPEVNRLAEELGKKSADTEAENANLKAEAEANYVKKMAEWEEYNPDQRDLFEFNGGEYASFGDTFNTKYEENYGEVRCDLDQFGWIYVHYNYGAETGAEFPDYEGTDA